jgi:putative phosphoesterase
MKIALLADIHANLPALEAVFDDLGEADLIVCAGDVLGYYADINEVCDLLRRKCPWVIRGNHDAYVTGFMTPAEDRADAYRAEWTRQNLDTENLSWLVGLPVEMTFDWDKKTIRVRHASPWDEETYVYPDSAHLNRIQLKQNEFLILGHTHFPMRVQCGEGIVVNPGSVGQPRDWNPLASYAILDTKTSAVAFRRVCYDVSGLQKRLIRGEWNQEMVDILSRHR